MAPLLSGARRQWRAVSGVGHWSILAAVVVTLVIGGALGRSTLATAQDIGQPQDPSFFPATGYRITSPAILDYFLHRGGVRTLGYPVSNDFPLLGKRVQLFQRQMLEVRPDGSVSPASILDAQILPITHIDGLTLPPVDPDLVGAAPPINNPEYIIQALSYVSTFVPDVWNDVPVNFQTTYLDSVSCADAFGDEPCDPSQLAVFALELWGLPTSPPTPDPLNNDFIYQRFERGIMHHSRATGLTQGLLVGDWLKRVIVGLNLSPDLDETVRASRVFNQFAPTKPLGLARPSELPDTSLAQAFRADTLSVAAQQAGTPTLPPGVAETATAVALTATAITGTQVALQGTSVALTSTAVVGTATVVSVPTPTVQLTPVSNIPVSDAGCMGDEQMWFVPRKPNVGVHVELAVTSQRHHDVRNVRLVGPLDSGVPIERLGPLGFVWTWTVVPAVEGFHEWTFYADGLRPCITSGFNTFAPLGATITPTNTREPTNTPGPTTPTATALPPKPVVAA
ncbi:MAG TPA: hypothetical protein VFG86_13230, partial [Chloroflexota bacterium]|nr:hypothetical protein [Chloroflexota bacterium]